MTNEEKISALQAMIRSQEAEEILSIYLKLAGSKIIAKAYPFRTDVTEVPLRYESLQIEIAAYMMNKRGAEGQLSHSENGTSRTYESGDVPPSLLKGVLPCCGTFE